LPCESPVLKLARCANCECLNFGVQSTISLCPNCAYHCTLRGDSAIP
jgi:hypothetical protein